jgi:predicted TPR repeat methyltransferase
MPMDNVNQEILALIDSNELPAALVKCQHMITINPHDPDFPHLQGLIFAKMGKMSEAVKSFSQALKLDPKQAIFHNNISNAYKKIGNLEQAERHLNEALLLSPNNAESYNNLGSLYYTQGRIQQALPLFEKAIRLNPNSWEAHYNLANCYIRTEMVLQAISHYQTVLKLNQNHGNAKLNLAMSFVSIKDYTSALPFLIEAATNNPQHAELQGHLAEAYLDLGKSTEAIEQYNKALALEPTRAEWQHNLAVLYLREKQYNLAKQHFINSLNINPDNHTAAHMLAALDNNTSAESAAPAAYVSDLFDQYASYYNQHLTTKLQYKVPQLLRQTMSKYLTDASKQQNILDLGCGTGMCGVYFRDMANFMFGVDLSKEMLAQAKALGAYDGLCRCNILQTIPGYNLNIFDLVLAADVFVYIGDLKPLFSMILTTLKEHAKLAFTIEELASQDDFSLQSTGRYAHSKKYISELCNELGFSISTMDTIVLREQDGKAIPGILYVLSKN